MQLFWKKLHRFAFKLIIVNCNLQKYFPLKRKVILFYWSNSNHSDNSYYGMSYAIRRMPGDFKEMILQWRKGIYSENEYLVYCNTDRLVK